MVDTDNVSTAREKKLQIEYINVFSGVECYDQHWRFNVEQTAIEEKWKLDAANG